MGRNSRSRLVNRISIFSIATAFTCLAIMNSRILGHEGPDPRASWIFDASHLNGPRLRSEAGPDLVALEPPVAESDKRLEYLRLDGNNHAFLAESSWKSVRQMLPTDFITISAWVSLDELTEAGAIFSAIQDNGDSELGVVLGYNDRSFSFGLASEGANDGDGKLTYISAKSSIELGRWYHVCAVYDGKLMQLYVNGELEAQSTEQSGKILYPDESRLGLGVYVDVNESWAMRGRLAQVVLYDLAAKADWVMHDFEHQKSWTVLPPRVEPTKEFHFVVKPYLQYGTQDSMRVLCELNRHATAVIRYGQTSNFTDSVSSTSDDGYLHTFHLKGLDPETGYYYQVHVKEDDSQAALTSDLSSFQTASHTGSPFAFAVIADTQGNPIVNGQLAKHAWGLRPNFVILPGDLVDDGLIKKQWANDFFASMGPLFSRVPFYPTIGNHERDSAHYYRYMDVPAPEYYYSFQYGNAKFFMIDSNKKVDAESEQYRWLESELKELEADEKEGKSSVVWKFVSYHHPSYSSDEDDYGNLWTGKSTWGDTRIRELTKLFDRYKVDVVWNGHIHSYERTWPIKEGRVGQPDGTVYMITGGGGGGLEQAGPIRPAFQNNVKRGHHFVFVAINGPTFELKSYDLEGRLFDTVKLVK